MASKPNHSRTVYLGETLTEEMRGHRLNWSRIAQRAFRQALREDRSPKEKRAELLARQHIKDEIRSQGKRISHYKISQIQSLARRMVAEGWTP